MRRKPERGTVITIRDAGRKRAMRDAGRKEVLFRS